VALESRFTFLVKQWKAQVFANPGDIDPENKEDWESLALGFALGKGLTAEDAHAFVAVLLRQNLI